MRVSPDARFILWLLTQDLSKRNMQRNFSILSDHARIFFSDSKSMGFWKSINERDTFLDRFDGEYNRYFFGPAPLEIKEPEHNNFYIFEIFI